MPSPMRFSFPKLRRRTWRKIVWIAITAVAALATVIATAGSAFNK